MGLVFDQRAALGTQPACHAFVVGVGAYPHLLGGLGATSPLNLGLTQLSAAVLSARRICEWLKHAKLAKPLATVRMLLSEDAAIGSEAEGATLDGFIGHAAAWQEDASRHRDNLTFFYFAGQGFSLSQGEHVLALQDFGNGIGPALRNTVMVNNIVDGMAPSTWRPEVGRTQLYFIDANRRRPTELQTYASLLPTAVFDVARSAIDDRATAIFYAASPDSDAYSSVKEGETFFSRALMTCLEGTAAVKQPDQSWAVSVQSLCQALPKQVANLATDAGVRQQVVIEGSLRDAVISHLDQPPLVGVALHLESTEATATAQARLSNAEGDVVAEWDARGSSAPPRVPAGLYILDVLGQRPNGSTFTARQFIQAVGSIVELTLKLPF